MTDSEPDAPDQVDDDLDNLLNLVVPVGHDLLAKRAPLMPFGAVVDLKGEAQLIATGERTSFQSLRLLVGGVREKRSDYRAVALVADARSRETGQDVLTVHFEYFDGDMLVCIKLLYPYTRTRFKRAVTFERRSGHGAEPLIWSEDPPSVGDMTVFPVDRG